MKLGLWNRLAIAATGLALIVGPIWIWLDMTTDATEASTARYQLCLDLSEAAVERTGDFEAYTDELRACGEMLVSEDYGPGWNEYGWAVLGVFVACLVFYLLIWALASLAKWVWRGREKPE